ncbi:hypothetical protein ANCCEY_08954 [Ancylostoma ceylanicum]|uniref:Uncharacterized protein n=1 Tax=Ancylostoma ceylanicum TaxID=53326 RepID=A0A0D6LIU4_9BILA|nr:hypothetical protein ANCCEY_08954 [Ancylostoma ceylanicum]
MLSSCLGIRPKKWFEKKLQKKRLRRLKQREEKTPLTEKVVDKYNGSSSEEEEESDEEVILPPRRSSQFRVATQPSPQEQKAAVLSDIRKIAESQQANETVVTEVVKVEKTDDEKRALEEREKMLADQQRAREQQAAAIQAAAAKAASAPQANNEDQGAEFANRMEEEMRKKAEACIYV